MLQLCYITTEYFKTLDTTVAAVPLNLKERKNNIILERYPVLNKNEPYIFVCNHTCPEDIENVFCILDRSAYLILGSIETMQYNRQAYFLWLNGVLPFDTLDKGQRKMLVGKMERVLKTNSILFFPEGSHNYSPNKLINSLFDGPVNLSLKTGRKIVVVTLIRDSDKNISYVDVSNPIELSEMESAYSTEKEYVNALSLSLRDKMSTAVFYMISRHSDVIKRHNYLNIENQFRQEKIIDSFNKLKWNKDIFAAEYITKKTKNDLEYEEVVNTLSKLELERGLQNIGFYSRLKQELDNKDVVKTMRNHWRRITNNR